MPWPDRKTNFQGDQFTYAIDEIDSDGMPCAYVAGANNLHVIDRAFDHALFYYAEHRRLRLREGARIMRIANGTGEWHKEHIKRTLGIDEP